MKRFLILIMTVWISIKYIAWDTAIARIGECIFISVPIIRLYIWEDFFCRYGLVTCSGMVLTPSQGAGYDQGYNDKHGYGNNCCTHKFKVTPNGWFYNIKKENKYEQR